MLANPEYAPVRGTMPRLVIADDHCLVAEGIEHLLYNEFELVEIVNDGPKLLDSVRRCKPDAVVSDISMPGMTGIEVLQQLRAEGIRTPFLFLTMHSEPALADAAMRAGASGYVLKQAVGRDLVAAVREVVAGGSYVTPSVGAQYLGGHLQAVQNLTKKQREVLHLLARGLRSKEIATTLGSSVRTIEAHKYTMMQVLGVHSTLELVRRAESLGLLF